MADPIFNLLAGLCLLAVIPVIFWPTRGLLARWERSRKVNQRVLREDAAKHMHKYEVAGRQPTVESLAGALQITLDEAADLLSRMESHGLVEMRDGSHHLSTKGRSYALHIIRAHRLWERYLADETGLPETEWHSHAEQSEHRFTPRQLDELSEQLGNPLHDPHGDPIPTSDGHIVPHGGSPLTDAEPGQLLRIVHVEDEPEVVYRQLIAEGLYPGMVGRINEKTNQRIVLWIDGEERRLAPILARNISVVAVREVPEDSDREVERLSSLSPGEEADVLRISRACRGSERRRLMDLGILPGTSIRAEMVSPGGDPTAYRVRGALIGLRREQTDAIFVQRTMEKKAS